MTFPLCLLISYIFLLNMIMMDLHGTVKKYDAAYVTTAAEVRDGEPTEKHCTVMHKTLAKHLYIIAWKIIDEFCIYDMYVLTKSDSILEHKHKMFA